MPYTTSPNPTGDSGGTDHAGGFIANKELPLVAGKNYTKLGVFSNFAHTFYLYLIKELPTAETYEVIRWVSFSHPGTGWVDGDISPFLVPEGNFFVGYYYPSEGRINYSIDMDRTIIWSQPSGTFTAEDSSGNCGSVRAYYEPPAAEWKEYWGALRTTGSGWFVLDDADHDPSDNLGTPFVVNGSSTNGWVEIPILGSATVVGVGGVTGDETYGPLGFTAGDSVGVSSVRIQFGHLGTRLSPNDASLVIANANFWFKGKVK